MAHIPQMTTSFLMMQDVGDEELLSQTNMLWENRNEEAKQISTLRIVPPTPSFRKEFLFGSETFPMLNQRTDLVNRQLVPSPKVSCFSYF